VAIKKFKESDDDEYVSWLRLKRKGTQNSPSRDQDLEATQA